MPIIVEKREWKPHPTGTFVAVIVAIPKRKGRKQKANAHIK